MKKALGLLCKQRWRDARESSLHCLHVVICTSPGDFPLSNFWLTRKICKMIFKSISSDLGLNTLQCSVVCMLTSINHHLWQCKVSLKGSIMNFTISMHIDLLPGKSKWATSFLLIPHVLLSFQEGYQYLSV